VPLVPRALMVLLEDLALLDSLDLLGLPA